MIKWFVILSFNFFQKFKILFWVVFIGSILALAVLSLRIQFEEDISKMLQFDEKTRQYNNIVQNTKLADKLVVSVSYIDTTIVSEDSIINCANSLVALLNNTNLIKKITLQVDDLPFTQVYSTILNNLPLFIDSNDYAQFDSLIEKKSIVNHLNGSLKLLLSPTDFVIKQTLPFDPIGVSNSVTNRLQNFGKASNYELYNGYFFLKKHKKLVFFIEPINPASETGKNKALISLLNKSIKSIKLNNSFKDININYIGSTAMAVGNAQQIQRDTVITLLILVLAIILIISKVFKKKRTPILIFLPVTFGLLFALAVVSFIKPTISLIAIGASSVLLGIAVNYPIHLLTHYLHIKNIKQVISDMVVPMTIGSLTTIGGFLCLLFVKSEILHDFGLLGAFSLMGAALFSLLILPHLMGKPQNISSTNYFEKSIERLANFNSNVSKWPIFVILILTPILLYFCQFVKFDSDLNNLNYVQPELKAAEQEMINCSDLSYSLYIVSYGKTINQALNASGNLQQIADKLTHLNIKNSYSSVASILPSTDLQKIRLRKWKEYWTDEKISKLTANLKQASSETGFTYKAFDKFFNLVKTPPTIINKHDYELLVNTFGGDVITQNKDITTIVSILKIPSNKVGIVSPMITNMSGNTLLDKKFLATTLMSNINSDFNFIAIFCAMLVFIALLITYGRIELALVAFIPMVVSWIWILGIMGLLNIQFNIINIILSTFIFALGDDYCIFIMDGLLQEYKTGKKHLPIIKISIVLSGITTLIGFGVLVFAQHPALRSIAIISVIGIFSVLIISQTLQPWLFKIFIQNQINLKRAPITALVFLKSISVFSFFVFGSLFLSVIGFFIVTLNFFAKEKGRYLFRNIIGRFMWMQMYMMPSVKKQFVNLNANTFNHPSVIICNHQSVIDILMVGLLSPKIITLTNKWVWNSPIFGFVVRNAGYFPIIDGVDDTLVKLQEKVNLGFSIAIFPEGTRSKDGKIGRFHKGAFYLANELKLDITPIIIHGSGYCIPKGSMVLRDNVVSIVVLPRIKYSDTSFGVTPQERTKSISKYFKGEYKRVSDEIEITSYFKQKLIDSYLFKGPILEWYLKVKIRMEKNYQLFDNIVPRQGVIVDAGCGYGFLSHMLAFTSPKRLITGIDYDEAKIDVAQNTFSKPENLIFKVSSITDFDYEQSDCFIFCDVLHYLSPLMVINTLNNCLNKLNIGGKIIVRDGDSRKFNHSKTKLSEFLSTQLLKFNKIENKLDFISIDLLINWAKEMGLTVNITENEGFASNIIIVFQKEV